MSRTSVVMVTTSLVFLVFPSSVFYVFSGISAKKDLSFTTSAQAGETGIPESTGSSEKREPPAIAPDIQDTGESAPNGTVLWDTGSLRLVADDEGEPRQLQTAIVTLVCPATDEHEEVRVDLVAALHIGDGTYYRTLNWLFRKYDSVLYELVANRGSRPPRPQPGRKREPSSLVSSAQILLGETLGLKFQLEEIDYTVTNFVHADLTPEQFRNAMEQRRDGLLEMFGRTFGYTMATGNYSGNSADVDLLMSLFSGNRKQGMRRAVAESLADSDKVAEILDGTGEEGSAIIAARNQAAMEVLKERIAAGDRRIAIFYGGAHIPDFERRITGEFNATRTTVRWITAWSL
ncbi:MAG: hypothetical protein Q4C47_09685 [Planctomycetia bacterium]|nr:hypothetical protein [Planctomycetia bacterium]